MLGLSRSERGSANAEDVAELCKMLLSARGEASGIALSKEILSRYQNLDEEQKTSFFELICADFSADPKEARAAAAAYLEHSGSDELIRLSEAARPKRDELLHRLNQAPDATRMLVDMRADLLDRLKISPDLAAVDRDFVQHFTAWFNRGFLELRNLDWDTPATILEKIIEYEAVHGMAGWRDLRERIDPDDRLIYGFFHPRLGSEPLIFVEIALMDKMPSNISDVLDTDRPEPVPSPKTAVFYSISNCQKGLRGIPLGSFLIKQVIEDLRQRFPSLKEFVTLSPIPSFRRALKTDRQHDFREATIDAANDAEMPGWWNDEGQSRLLAAELLPAAQWFLANCTDPSGRPIDPVARFHLGNGARLERVNWNADISKRGLDNALGMMANYRYRLDEIEHNHENFANGGKIITSGSVARAAKNYGNRIREHRVDAEVAAGDPDKTRDNKETV